MKNIFLTNDNFISFKQNIEKYFFMIIPMSNNNNKKGKYKGI